MPEGIGMVVYLPEGRQAALFRIGESIFAIDNVCPHMGGPLGDGELSENIVTCPWHGWTFNVETGACQNMPGEDVMTYRVELADGSVYIIVDE